MPFTTNYTSVSHPEKLEQFYKGRRRFWCPRHKSHDDWRLTETKNKSRSYAYIRCAACYRDAAKKFNKENVFYSLFNDARQHAKSMDAPFRLSQADIEKQFEVQKGRCKYTKIQFGEDKTRPSLDQIKPKKGYRPSNIQLVSFTINRMKSDFEEERFIRYCKLVCEPQEETRPDLRLSRSIKRVRTRNEVDALIEKVKANDTVACTKHGLHKEWRITVNSVKCRRCERETSLSYNRRHSSINGGGQFARQKTNRLSRVRRWKAGKTVKCDRHGWHKEFRFFSTNPRGQKYEYVKCKICEKEAARERRKSSPLTVMFNERKYGATRIGVEFDLTFNDILEMYIQQKGRCALTNVVFTHVRRKPSLDRRDPTKGYVHGNVQLTLYAINRMKSDIPEHVFKRQCRLVAKHNQ